MTFQQDDEGKSSPRIAENPSFAEHSGLLKFAKLFRRAYRLMNTVGLSSTKLDKIAAATDRATALETVLTLPDRFNAVFAERGWIATDALSVDVMEEALRQAADGDPAAAEEVLAARFDEENLRLFAVVHSRRFHPVQEREDQIEEAIRLYFEGRYWAALPLILIAADGFASDVLGYSPFKEGADLSAFDSIVGHNTGLPKLILAVSRSRKKSTAAPLALPFRHGILHGRDLGYADRVTCAKGWLLFVALVDWAIAKSTEPERLRADKERRNLSWRKIAGQLQHNEAMRKELDDWSPHEVFAPLPEHLDPSSPEAALFDFLNCWKAKNYGGMAQQSVDFAGASRRKLAGEMRSEAEPIQLINFDFVKLRQSTPVRADGQVCLKLLVFNRESEAVCEAGLLRMLPNGDLAMQDDSEGRWFVMRKLVWDAYGKSRPTARSGSVNR